MKRRHISYWIGIILSAYMAFLVLEEVVFKSDLKVSDLSWVIERNKCRVTFTITNNTDRVISRAIKLIAYNLPEQTKFVEMKVIQEKPLEITLQPKASKQIEEQLTPAAKRVEVLL